MIKWMIWIHPSSDGQPVRELDRLKMLYAHEEELATIEADKVKAKFQSMAMESVAKAEQKRGGLFGSIGDAISGVADHVFKVANVKPF